MLKNHKNQTKRLSKNNYDNLNQNNNKSIQFNALRQLMSYLVNNKVTWLTQLILKRTKNQLIGQ